MAFELWLSKLIHSFTAPVLFPLICIPINSSLITGTKIEILRLKLYFIPYLFMFLGLNTLATTFVLAVESDTTV